MGFSLSTLLFSLLLVLVACIFIFGTARWPNLWRTLPRHRNLGIVPGAACLVWSAAYAMSMFETLASPSTVVLKIMVPVLIILAYFFMSYIFTRALGGLLILSVTHLLAGAFAVQPPARPLFALLCYLLALGGLGLILFPWFFRDMLERAASSKKWRYVPAALFTGTAIILSTIALL